MTATLRVLMIEDSEDDSLLLLRTLQRSGYEPQAMVVTTEAAMRQALTEKTFDLILADYNLPDFSAEKALEVLNELLLDIPFIIVSGSIGELTAVSMMRQGAQDYLMKDNLARLPAVIERELQETEIRRQKKQADEQMLLAARQWRETFDSISDVVLIMDEDYHILQANQAARTLLDNEHPEGCLCYRIVHGTSAPPPFCPHRRIFSDGKPRRLELHALNLGDHWYDLRTSPVLDSAGKVVRMVHSLRDITDQKRAEETLRETEKQLRQAEKMQAVGQLAGGIAHDFNNQLTGIMGFADLLIGTLENARHRDFAREIIKAATRAAELTAQLLAYSRKGNFITATVDINSVVREVLSILSHSLDKRIVLHTDLCSPDPLVRGDYTQLQSALLNLSLNARDAMPGGGTLRFETSVVTLGEGQDAVLEPATGPHVLLRVRDTGIGIPEEIRHRIFEPFFTTKPVGKGTGLGLAAVYGTVMAHHGVIDFDSQPGEGTVFRIYLPLAPASGAPATPYPDQPVGGSEHIMVVDDDTASLEVATESLRTLGYKVTPFSDGQEALNYFSDNWREVDLVLLDLMLPLISGKEVFWRLRAIQPDVRVLLASGYSIDTDVQELVQAGAQSFVQKPFRYHELSWQIRNALPMK